jgi:hypothetical protein
MGTNLTGKCLNLREKCQEGEENHRLGSFLITFFTECCYWDAQSKEGEMGIVWRDDAYTLSIVCRI